MNENIMKFFKEISQIPRCSGDEKGISDYLLTFATDRNLSAFKEEGSGNIIIKKPATSGYEQSKTVILQGHMDMVCEKNSGISHDFTKDAISLIEKDGWLCADGTTLGADNGVAVAYALSILDDSSLAHPPLEIIITTDEETSMKGAENLNPQSLSGEILLNLDAGDEGVFFVSSAGGRDYQHILSIERETANHDHYFSVQVSGLKGGHSGEDIDKERGNSIKILGRTLYELGQSLDFQLMEISGGSKINAIPREAQAMICLSPEKSSVANDRLSELEKIFNQELKGSDQVKLDIREESSYSGSAMTKDSRDKLIDLILLIPFGINKMSKEIPGLVVCSQNLGVLETKESEVILYSSIRSSEASLKELTIQKMELLTKAFGARSHSDGDYPAWAYQSDSPLRTKAGQVYEKVTGQKAEMMAVHAGLECGFFADKLENNPIDIISFGPTMKDIHSPDERLDIESFGRVYDFLVALLAELK